MWFRQSPDNRIIAWRNWRKSLENLSQEQALENVAKTWAQVPTVSHYLAPDLPNEWPNPWQLITDNIYCDLSIALGMCYSLSLIESLEIADLKLKIYQTPTGWLNLPSVDQGKYVLNYNHAAIVNSSCVTAQHKDLAFEYSKVDLFKKIN